MTKESEFLRKRHDYKRTFFVDAQKTSYEAFIDEIEYAEAYQENEHLAIKVIEMLRKKYNLLWL